MTYFGLITAACTMSNTKQYSKPLLLGATGRVGGLILQEALSNHMQVTALVRDASKLAPQPNLRIVEGSPLSQSDLQAAMAGCDSVITALANSRTSDMPWAAQVSPLWFMRDAMQATVSAMQATGLRRLVVMSTWGSAEDMPHTPWLFRFIVRWSTLNHTFKDHTAKDEVAKQSGLDWTLLRPVGFQKGEADGMRVVIQDSSTNVGMSRGMINRAVVARYTMQALNNQALMHKTPVMTQEKTA